MTLLSVDNAQKALSAQETIIQLGNIVFWPNRRLLVKQGQTYKLRYKESETLRLLCENYPNPVTRQEFEKTVWSEGYVIAHTITQTIKSLRAALGDANRDMVITLPKQGYALNLRPQRCSDMPPPDHPEKSLLVTSLMTLYGRTTGH